MQLARFSKLSHSSLESDGMAHARAPTLLASVPRPTMESQGEVCWHTRWLIMSERASDHSRTRTHLLCGDLSDPARAGGGGGGGGAGFGGGSAPRGRGARTSSLVNLRSVKTLFGTPLHEFPVKFWNNFCALQKIFSTTQISLEISGNFF